MKTIIKYLFVVVIVTSCKSNLEEINLDTKHPSYGTVPSETLFTGALLNLFDNMVTPNVNSNVFRYFAQQWTETTYTDEVNYDVQTRNIPDNFWYYNYTKVLNNLKNARELVKAEKPITAAEKDAQSNKLLVIEIVEIYTYKVLVDTFGNIPYSEAMNPDKVNPRYDDGKTIYLDLVKRIDAANAAMKLAAGSFGDADKVYAGDMNHWKKFANGIKLNIGINLADADAATAKTIVEAAAKGVFDSNNDNFALPYSPSVPNTNPVWINLIQSGRHDDVPANTVVDLANSFEDPRREVYFTPLDGKYVGGPYAAGGNYTNFSQVGETITNPDREGLLMDFSEIAFGLAEAAARGYSVGGTAEEFYNKAIMASMEYWGVHDANAHHYLESEAVAYATARGDFREKIGNQIYLALYNRGHEAWTAWRRLDSPKFNLPDGKTYAEIPVRYTFPSLEGTLNNINYLAAGTAIGGDKLTTKLFWDKK